ncbi:MAG: pyrimidine/purine nucleoside phosphorylase [Opitutaceae bacterium]
MSTIPDRFDSVTVLTKASVYFDGGVISHTLLLPDGSKKTLGLIRPGSYHFATDAAERMEIVAGACRVVLDGKAGENDHPAGSIFEIPARSGFTITVASGICEYICSFLK